MRLEVEVDTSGVEVELRRLGLAADDVRPALEEIADDFRRHVARTFDTEGRSVGMPWRANDPDYLRAKVRAGKGSKILQIAGARGGVLRRSVTREHAPDHVERVTRDQLEVGTRMRIAALHQRGGVRARSHTRVPARPFVVVDRAAEQRWARIVQDHLVPSGRGL